MFATKEKGIKESKEMTIIRNTTIFGRVNLNGASTSAESSSQSSLPTNIRPPSADTFAGSNQASTSRLDNEQLNQSSSGQQTSATEEVNGRSGSNSIIKFLIVDIMQQRQALRDIVRTQLAQVGQVRRS